MNTVAVFHTAAKLRPEWKSFSEVPPSPMYATVTTSFPASLSLYAWPTAWALPT